MPNGEKPGDAAGERARSRFDRLRRDRDKAIRDLEDADWDDETSEVMARVAADAAAGAATRTAKQLSGHDIERESKGPQSVFQRHPHARVVGIIIAVATGIAAGIGIIVQALRQAGVLK